MTAPAWDSFQLVPDDVLFFRDGKPSTRGTDHYLRSLFPPYPTTLYGALRTRRLADAGVELAGLRERTWEQRLGEKLVQELGAWGGFGSLALRGPWLVHEGEPLLPAPLDLGLLLEPAGSDKAPPKIASVVRFLPDLQAEKRWSHPLARLTPAAWTGSGWVRWTCPALGVEPSSAAGWYLKPAGLLAWRNGGAPSPDHFVRASDLWTEEARTGVGLQTGQRTSEDGLLYTFGFIRLLPGVALGFEVQGSFLATGGRVRLGGEGRTAVLETGPGFPEADLQPRGELVVLSYASPAVSHGGAYPPGFSETRLEGTLGGRRLRLVAAAVPGFLPIGGWDLARGEAKPLRRAIPSGSVYVFQPLEGSGAADAAAALHGLCLTENLDALDRQGFGLAVAGAVSGGPLGNENLF
ncbi:MAG TPA: type III-B CRISPR module-associated Cmr3 family protein [Thermoanaerobaculia bacterium]|jgi:CRISPR-associated protein Cmr3|nr:type III-B CRISPR module-associated Cmr3 family protein [Thermoanaerobaculia bacterium]